MPEEMIPHHHHRRHRRHISSNDQGNVTSRGFPGQRTHCQKNIQLSEGFHSLLVLPKAEPQLHFAIFHRAFMSNRILLLSECGK